MTRLSERLTVRAYLAANPAMDGGTGWTRRHDLAVSLPNERERGIVGLITALHGYAEHYKATIGNGDPVGTDGFCGPYFEDIAKACIGLLSAEIGRLDGGTLDHAIRQICADNSVELE